MPLLELKEVSRYYLQGQGLFGRKRDVIRAVDKVSLVLNEGESLGLVGESGCGKSTLAKLILKLERPNGGQIIFRGQDVLAASLGVLYDYRRQVQLVFQDSFSAFNPRMRVIEILNEPLENFYPGQRATYWKRTCELLELVGLHQDCLDHYPHQLSGGQRQRLGIARALVSQPKLLICDEAIANLDVSLQGQMLSLFQELKAKLGLSYIFISHNLPAVQYLADKIAVMYGGKIVEVLSREQLLRDAQHPYTLSLLDALPVTHPRERNRKRLLLKGEACCGAHGCRFHPRCPEAQEICHQHEPALWEGEEHQVACHLVKC